MAKEDEKKKTKFPNVVIKENPSCPICCLSIPYDWTAGLFFGQLSADEYRVHCYEKFGFYPSEKDVSNHKQKHIMADFEAQQIKKNLKDAMAKNESAANIVGVELKDIEMLNAAIQTVSAKLLELNASTPMWIQGQESLTNQLARLIQLRREVLEGKKLQIKGKLTFSDLLAIAEEEEHDAAKTKSNKKLPVRSSSESIHKEVADAKEGTDEETGGAEEDKKV